MNSIMQKYEEKKDALDSFFSGTRGASAESAQRMIGAVLTHGLSISMAARRSFCHRNSVTYWCDQLKKETGLDIHKDVIDAAVTYMYMEEYGMLESGK